MRSLNGVLRTALMSDSRVEVWSIIFINFQVKSESRSQFFYWFQSRCKAWIKLRDLLRSQNQASKIPTESELSIQAESIFSSTPKSKVRVGSQSFYKLWSQEWGSKSISVQMRSLNKVLRIALESKSSYDKLFRNQNRVWVIFKETLWSQKW